MKLDLESIEARAETALDVSLEGDAVTMLSTTILIKYDIHALLSAIKEMKVVLEFYGDERNYTKDGIIFDQYLVGPTHEPVEEQVQDYGTKARAVLEKYFK